MRRLATVLLVVVGCAGACSFTDDSPSSSTSTSSTALDGSTASSTSSSTTRGTGTTVARPGTAAQAAERLVAAWKANNRAAANQVASPTAVDKLFARRYTGPAPTFQGCESQGAVTNCSYRFEGTGMTFLVEGSVATGYRVEIVDFTAD